VLHDLRTLTRRELIARSAAVAAALGLAACAPGAPAPIAQVSAQPKRGGTLTWGQWDANDDIDPAGPSGASGTEVVGNILDPLVTLDANANIVPLLASKWVIEDDAKKFTFTLREGVKFHDGTAFDATSVKRSWERIIDPRTKAANTATILGPISKIEAADPRTLVVTFKEPNPLFLLSLWRPWFGPMSNAYLDTVKPGDKANAPVGTGPFKFASRSADGVYTLTANPDYTWGPASASNRGAPYLASLKFRSVPEGGTRVATLESGENMFIDELSEADWARLKDDKRFGFTLAPRRGLGVGFTLNVTKPPTDDRAVREALNWAIDRKSIVEKLFFGVHRVTVGPLSEGVWGRLDELEKQLGYDQAKARKLLDDAGWKLPASGGIREKGGQKLALSLVTFGSPWREMATAVQSQLREVGVDVQFEHLARAAYLDLVRSYKHNLCQTAGTNFDPDELRLRYHSAQVKLANFSGLTDPQLDALLVKGSRQVPGTDERRKTYEDAQRRLMELFPTISIMTQVRVEAYAAKVHDVKMNPTGLNAFPMTDAWMES
jgi:peptide/nickel transport system substrate-binding protein